MDTVRHDARALARPRILLVDDDERFCWALRRSFEQRGYEITVAHSVQEALDVVEECPPEYIVVDLRMPGVSGLTLVSRLRADDRQMPIVVLTGYASIATAVEAIRLGATNYLTKPVDADTIERAFVENSGHEHTQPAGHPMSVERLEWEHIQQVLTEHRGNISATARALGMHRRTLQRKLNKHPVRR